MIIIVSTVTTGTLLLLVIHGTIVIICTVCVVVNMRREQNKGTYKYYEHLDSVKNYTKAYIAVSVLLQVIKRFLKRNLPHVGMLQCMNACTG